MVKSLSSKAKRDSSDPVSNLVNTVKTDDPRCVEPVQVERDMFEKPWWGD